MPQVIIFAKINLIGKLIKSFCLFLPRIVIWFIKPNVLLLVITVVVYYGKVVTVKYL